MPLLMTLKDFAAEYRTSRSSAYVEINARRLRAVKVGGRTMIRREDAEAWFKSLREYTPRPAA